MIGAYYIFHGILWIVGILVNILWHCLICETLFETCLWIGHLYFLKNKQGICTCIVLAFLPGLEKMSIIWKIWNFHPWLKIHLGLAEPSRKFNSLYRVEIFACNYNVILKRSLLFNRDEISTRFNPLKC